MKQLNQTEINLALKKIRTRYEQIIKEFKKSRLLLENFEDRYIKTLRAKMDVSVFIIAEIEAVEELYKREEARKKIEIIDRIDKKIDDKSSFADKVMEENRKKIEKYPKVSLGNDASEEVERLLGAVRDFLNNYWPAITIIYKENRYNSDNEKLNNYFHKLLSTYDYKGDMPIARHYIDAINRKPKDFKKIDYEYRFILQETAFLLNDILDTLTGLLEMDKIPSIDKKINCGLIKLETDSWFREYFENLNHKECVKKVKDHIELMINDFRFKGIKKGY